MRPNVATHPQVLKALTDASSMVSRLITEYDWSDDLASPLEAVFAIWWRAHTIIFNAGDEGDGLDIFPQRTVKVGEVTYRLDFEVLPEDPHLLEAAEARKVPVPLIGVEIDDDASHHSSPKHVVRRNIRDADLMAADWRIFHFSQAEILTDPRRCVTAVREYARKVFLKFEGQVSSASPS